MTIFQTVDSHNHGILKSSGLVLATVLLVGGCSATPSLPVLTDAPPKPVDSVQTMFQVGSNRFDGFWDIHASGDKDEQPLHGQLSKRGLKRGKLVYLPDSDFSGEDFLAIRLLQSTEPFTMYRYFNLLVN